LILTSLIFNEFINQQLKQHYYAYNSFNWIDENGMTVGFNDVWATNKREAIKNHAKDYTWGRMTGMFVRQCTRQRPPYYG
jgi:hypothetical protein